ncbi:hypothetical protein AAY473_026515 [Plecturocebus cupreus]
MYKMFFLDLKPVEPQGDYWTFQKEGKNYRLLKTIEIMTTGSEHALKPYMMESRPVAQARMQWCNFGSLQPVPLGSNDSPASASRVAGFTEETVSPCWPGWFRTPDLVIHRLGLPKCWDYRPLELESLLSCLTIGLGFKSPWAGSREKLRNASLRNAQLLKGRSREWAQVAARKVAGATVTSSH